VVVVVVVARTTLMRGEEEEVVRVDRVGAQLSRDVIVSFNL
jgi:hypothetical protein